jgi:hypothetical protein
MKSIAIKCYKMTITRSTKLKNYTYSLDNHLLEHVSENPYLEQLISDNLKWSSYINKITNRATSILGFLGRNLKHCSKTLKETAYISLVRSVLDYSSTVWDPYLQQDIDRLELIQRRAARFAYNDYGRTTSATEMMKKLDWKPLSERRREQRLILMYKIVNDLIAIPAETHITLNRGITRSSTTNKLKLYSCNSDIYKHSFIPRTIIDWNNLSERCTRATSLETFKGELRGQGVPPCDYYDESTTHFLDTIFSSEVPAQYSTDTDTDTFNEMIVMSAWYYTNTLNWIFIALVHRNNSPRVDISLNSATLS